MSEDRRIGCVLAGMMCLWGSSATAPAQVPASASSGPSVPAAPAGGLRWAPGDVLAPDFVGDSASPASKAGALRIVAARNGTFSGKVVLSSDAPIRGLSVNVDELKGPGTIATSAVQARYALPWGRIMTNRAREGEEVA